MLVVRFTGGSPVARDYLRRKCPYCWTRFVLYVYPGGFGACTNKECKTLALDESMDWSERERKTHVRNRRNHGTDSR